MSKRGSLEQTLCLKYCAYYKPGKNEELACRGYTVVERFIREGKGIVFEDFSCMPDPGVATQLVTHFASLRSSLGHSAQPPGMDWFIGLWPMPAMRSAAGADEADTGAGPFANTKANAKRRASARRNPLMPLTIRRPPLKTKWALFSSRG